MRYMLRFVFFLICALPLTAYGFGSAEDVRIAKAGPVAELVAHPEKTVIVTKKEKEVLVTSTDKALEARLNAMEQKIEKLKAATKSDKQIKAIAEAAAKSAVESKTKELDTRIDNKFVDYDNKQASEAEADKKAKAREKTDLDSWKKTQETKVDAAVKAAKEMKSSVWWTLGFVIAGLILLYAIVCAIGVMFYRRKP